MHAKWLTDAGRQGLHGVRAAAPVAYLVAEGSQLCGGGSLRAVPGHGGAQHGGPAGPGRVITVIVLKGLQGQAPIVPRAPLLGKAGAVAACVVAVGVALCASRAVLERQTLEQGAQGCQAAWLAGARGRAPVVSALRPSCAAAAASVKSAVSVAPDSSSLASATGGTGLLGQLSWQMSAKSLGPAAHHQGLKPCGAESP